MARGSAALAIVYIRFFVREPPVWLENRRQQRLRHREVRPIFQDLSVGMIANTLNACWWMASGFVNNSSVVALFPSYLQKDLHLSPGLVALPILLQNAVLFVSSLGWGGFGSDRPPLGGVDPVRAVAALRTTLSADRQLYDHCGLL